jgi:knotted carbamoyltransferase YgeW
MTLSGLGRELNPGAEPGYRPIDDEEEHMSHAAIREQLDAFRSLKSNLFRRDFLLTWDHPRPQIEAVLALAEILKSLHQQGISYRSFDSGLAISIFRDNSTRTRFSFASAASAMGLSLADLDEQKSQIAHGETVRETANMISFLAEVIGIRDDMFLGEGNRYMREVGEALTDGARHGVLHRRPSIVNLQCDVDHPTQSLADLAWLKKHFGGLDQLKGKKIAMTWAYSPSYGKPLSVPQGIIGLMTRFGMEVTLAHPEGYGLIPEVLEVARKNAAESGGKFQVVGSMEEAFRGAHVVYPKSWAPYGVMQRRTELLQNSDKAGLASLEKECLANNARFVDWECDRAKMDLTHDRSALYMHCLPADITDVSCKRGEVSAEVFEQYRIATYHEASYKPFVISALMFLSRIEDPAARLASIVDRARS